MMRGNVMDVLSAIVLLIIMIIAVVWFGVIIVYFVMLLWRRRIGKILLPLFAAVLIFGMVYTYLNPAFVCPEEYRQYVSAEDEEYLLRLWGGFYGHTPLFATRISVIYADEETIQVEVDYSIFGSRVMSHGPDGIGVDEPLGRW